jgi:hypothetical protein
LIEGGKTGFSTSYVPETNGAVTTTTGEKVWTGWGPMYWYYDSAFVAYESVCYSSCAKIEETDRRMFGAA